MSSLQTFTVEDNLSPPSYIFPSVTQEFYRSSITGPIQGDFREGLLQNFLTAYRHDLPLHISPDDIWLLICQGFSHHVNKNAEQLRSYFVSFEGKETITVERLELSPRTATVDDWIDIISEIPSKLQEKVKGNLIDNLSFNFSTTSKDTRVAGHVILMASLKEYFNFQVIMDGCGIPYIELDGTIEDWENILYKTESLKQYQLSWWIDEIVPILQKIIQTKKGNIDIKFWKSMIKEKSEPDLYDPDAQTTYISGWICKFFPYNQSQRRHNLKSIHLMDDIPPQILEAPFVLQIVKTGEKFNCTFHSGFLGVTQDPNTFVVKPNIGWYITVEDQQ